MNDPWTAEANLAYFRRFGFWGRQIAAPPHQELGLAIVIPCCNEPDLVRALDALWACERPACAVEVIVVLNSACHCDRAVLEQNELTWREMKEWQSRRRDGRFQCHILACPNLPSRHAGVGLARKIGMDEASGRLIEVSQSREGIIAGFDADCECSTNYLVRLTEHFQKHPETPACSIYFEHPLSGPLPARVYEAVTYYELHLRYYVQALRWVRFPYAYHTVGSAMAVRAEVYQKQGGMNRRQAGEDFYFLQKLIALGEFTDLNSIRVIPSPRASDRVPFGTGQAVRQFLKTGELCTYPLEAFRDLGALLASVELLHSCPEKARLVLSELPSAVVSFLEAENFFDVLEEVRANTASFEAFRKRFFGWLNGFRVMKFVHHARDQSYGGRPVRQEAGRLLASLQEHWRECENESASELLLRFRELDRG